VIIRDLVFKARKYHHEFAEAGEGVATNALASRLVDLKGYGIVSKLRDPLITTPYLLENLAIFHLQLTIWL